MNLPLISVVIPTYMRPVQTLKIALNSVITQSYKNIEVIVVDDSPETYEGRDAIENYLLSIKDDRIKLIKHEKNKGANVARNTGIKNSTGEFVAFLDDDDEWMPNKLQKQCEVLNNNPDLGLVYCSTEVITMKNGMITKTHISEARHRGDIFGDLCEKNFIGSTSCAMVRRSVFDEVGLFDVNLESAQDYEMYLRISHQYPIDFADGEPLLRYFKHDQGTISSDKGKAIRSREYIHKKYADVFNENPKYLNLFLLRKSNYYMVNNKCSEAIFTWIKAISLQPANFKKNFLTLLRLIRNYFKVARKIKGLNK